MHTHTPGAVGSRPGSSWGFGALLKGLTSVVDTSCRSWDLNPQPWVTSGFKSNALSIRPRLPQNKQSIYAVMDDQSNRSLARSAFFEMFKVADNTAPYTLRTCAGIKQTEGRRADGFIVESFDGKTCLSLPSLI